jgi:hypothetical protein
VGAVVASQMFNPDSIPQVLAQDDNGNGTRTHEGCSIGPIFDYSASLSELEFGAVVNCTSNTMLYIRIDAYLYKMDTDDEWVHIRTANKACYVSRNCTADRTIDNPADGDYQLMYCFNAYSIGSSWSYTCFYGEYEIP